MEFDGYTWRPSSTPGRFVKMGKPITITTEREGLGSWLSRGGPFASNYNPSLASQTINEGANLDASRVPPEVLKHFNYKHPIISELDRQRGR